MPPVSRVGNLSARFRDTTLHPVNPALVAACEGPPSAVVIRKVKEAELDEMWSFVGSKKQPRWLWEALDHQTGRVMAYVFGRREDEALLHLKGILAPLGIRRFYTDGWGAYRRHLYAEHTKIWLVSLAAHRVCRHSTRSRTSSGS